MFYQTLPYVGLLPAGTPSGLDPGLGTSIPAPPASAFINDPEMVDYFESFVSVLIDANADGAESSARGVRVARYVPDPSGVPLRCHIAFKERGILVIDTRQIPVFFVRVLFPYPVALDVRHRLDWLDPDRGTVRQLFVRDASDNPGRTREYWAVDCYERLKVNAV